MFNTRINVISGSENIVSVWKSKDLDSKPAVCLVMDRFFCMPKKALKSYYTDISGIRYRPHPNSQMSPEDRIYYHTHRATHGFMSGKSLAGFADRFQSILLQHLGSGVVGGHWITRPDLFEFIQVVISTAAIEAMCGPLLSALSPNFIEDFWAFDRSLLYHLKGYPEWLSPGIWKTRRRCLQALKLWHQQARERFHESYIELDGHDPFFGSPLIRERQKYFSKMSAMNADAMASEDFGLIWGYVCQHFSLVIG